MVKKKGKSKRITLKDKFKIKKKTNETHRKIRKQAKRDAKNGVVRNEKKPKDPGIPNSWPFKQDLLNEIAKAREQASSTSSSAKKPIVSNLVPVKTLEEFMAMAQSNRVHFDAKSGKGESQPKTTSSSTTDNTQTTHSNNKTLYGQQSRRAYLRELGKVIDASDVILQVLDARDPLGTRIHPTVENVILGHADKKMVLVLNKIDLIPKAAVSGWLTYLRKSHPTLAMKCGTNVQGSKDHIGRSQGDSALESSCGVGVEHLLNLLKNYSRSSFNNKKKKTCISVGIIGYPNTGKSSILNTLKRCRAVGVSPRPGFTTSLQEVVLDKNIRLIDSPGVVFDEYDDTKKDTASLFLKNCIDVDSMEDPIPAVEALLNRCTLQSLIMTYNIPAFPQGNTMMFLAMVAKQYGKVLKGGIPDKVAAARAVLRDWNSGKIPYYTPPPPSSSTPPLASSTVDTEDKRLGHSKNIVESGNVQILSDFSQEFDISQMDAEVLKSLDERDEMDFVCMEPVDDHKTKKGGASEEWIRHQMTSHEDENAGDEEEDEDEDMSEEDEDMEEDEDEEEEGSDDEDEDSEEEDVDMDQKEYSAKTKKASFQRKTNADLEDYF